MAWRAFSELNITQPAVEDLQKFGEIRIVNKARPVGYLTEFFMNSPTPKCTHNHYFARVLFDVIGFHLLGE